jgi:hypothetical protein
MRIVTSHVYPPIPTRDHDWCAFYDGEEEAGNYAVLCIKSTKLLAAFGLAWFSFISPVLGAIPLAFDVELPVGEAPMDNYSEAKFSRVSYVCENVSIGNTSPNKHIFFSTLNEREIIGTQRNFAKMAGLRFRRDNVDSTLIRRIVLKAIRQVALEKVGPELPNNILRLSITCVFNLVADLEPNDWRRFSGLCVAKYRDCHWLHMHKRSLGKNESALSLIDATHGGVGSPLGFLEGRVNKVYANSAQEHANNGSAPHEKRPYGHGLLRNQIALTTAIFAPFFICLGYAVMLTSSGKTEAGIVCWSIGVFGIFATALIGAPLIFGLFS